MLMWAFEFQNGTIKVVESSNFFHWISGMIATCLDVEEKAGISWFL